MIDDDVEMELAGEAIISIDMQTQAMLNSLDGSVQSQGISVNHRDWLDMGSESFDKVPEIIKAAAIQAAVAGGWSREGIRRLMLSAYKHLTPDVMDMTFNVLEDLVRKHPMQIDKKPITLEVGLKSSGQAETKKFSVGTT